MSGRSRLAFSTENLAADIARRGLLQGLSVRLIPGEDGAETGHYAIPAGSRRFQGLELLVEQKRLAKDAPVPCIVCEDGIAKEDSLAENVQRAPLHPFDQFRAFQALREKGQSEEEIAAGSTPERATASRIECAASVRAGAMLNAPLQARPIGVLAVDTITASSIGYPPLI